MFTVIDNIVLKINKTNSKINVSVFGMK